MTPERKKLIARFQQWIDSNPQPNIMAIECANIAEKYASQLYSSGEEVSDKLQKGCVVFMKASSGMQGYGNVQCVSSVIEPLGEISLYGHNQCYKTYDVDHILEYPAKKLTRPVVTEGEINFLCSFIPTWAKETEPGLDPTFYGTLSYGTDLKIVNKVKAILTKLNIAT